MAVMTGTCNGVIRSLGEGFERSLRRSICLLYHNKLPLRHVFQALDGTLSTNFFLGSVRKCLKDCVFELSVAKLSVITSFICECSLKMLLRN